MKLLRLGLTLLAILGLGLAMARTERDISVPPVSAVSERGVWPLSWSRRLLLGETLRVQGSFPKSGDSVTLSDPVGVVARARAAPEFELRAVPKAVGRFLYRVEVEPTSAAPGVSQLVDVEVLAPPALRILWLESAPRFESKFFKAWAGRFGSSVALRSAISLDREREEFLNQARLDLRSLSREAFGSFDLVILDDAVLARMSATDTEALRQAVELDGLGVLLLAESMLDNVLGTKLRLERLGDLEERAVKLRQVGAKVGTISPLPGPALQIEPKPPWVPVEQDSQGLWVGAWAPVGRGRIGVSLLRSTYQWVLEGNPRFHAERWSSWTGCLARARESQESWSVEAPGAVWVDRPVALTLATRQDRPEASISGERLALWQSPAAPLRWHALFWPNRVGWHQIGSGQGAAWFYAQPPSLSNSASPAPSLASSWPPLAVLLGLLLFAGSMFSLWLLEKQPA